MKQQLGLICAALLAVGMPPSALAAPASTQNTAPQLFQQWLRAINARDVPAIKAFYGKYLDDPDPQFDLDVAEDTCGFTLQKIEAQSPTAMTVLLRERCAPTRHRLRIELGEPGAVRLKTFRLRPLPLPGDGAARATAAIATRLAAKDKFAGSLVVVVGGTRELARSWGTYAKGSRRAITPDTPMFLASAGKMFTAVSVLQLVDAGKVELDAPLGRYLTDYPNAETAKVTIRQLLNHRGGTGDIALLGQEDAANRAWVRTIDDLIRLNGKRPPDFPPGTKADYSNYGFVLLGAVVERVSGEAYPDYVARHVFAPAGMTQAGFPDRDHLQNVATGYTTWFGKLPRLTPNFDTLPWRGTPAGGSVASAYDMVRFFAALRAGKLIPPPLLAEATTPSATPWYGMGFVASAKTPKVWGHGGFAAGANVALQYYPEKDATFICMASRDSVCDRLIFAWLDRAFGDTN